LSFQVRFHPASGLQFWLAQAAKRHMDNKAIAGILYETADLMEINGDDSFRIRSYRNAAEAIEGLPQAIEQLVCEPKKLLEVPGIGKSMAEKLQEICKQGKLSLHAQLLEKYHPSMLELLKIQGLGPKTIALIWSAYKISDLAGVEKLAREGKLHELPRMGEKQEQKILKAIEDYRRIAGRYCLDEADKVAQKLGEHLSGLPGVEKITTAGSLRRGRETVGDLDILVTGNCCTNAEQREAVIEKIVGFPGIRDVIGRGENKVSFRLRSGMQVDVRLLPPDSFGAAMQYFTGSKSHNVALRQRALKMGYTLSEYGLDEFPPGAGKPADGSPVEGGKRVAGKTEEEIYARLKLDYIPPELRENCGEIEAAAEHRLPQLITVEDLQGDVHMHTVETDGKCTIEEMAEAARARGYKYMAITDHSKNLAFANGLDDERALKHIEKIRKADEQFNGIKIFAGIEVDILADGDLDLSDSVLKEMDLVIASVHSAFNQDAPKMTERLLRAVNHPYVSVIGHPTGRILLRRDAYPFDMEKVLNTAAQNKVAMELNAYPDRLDLNDRHLRMAKERGVKVVINTDAHHTSHMEKIRYGVLQARRAWLTPSNVLNALPAEKFARAMKRA
jgi:DNA polymerase (family 10)